jgi:hypothetical protein
MLKETPSDFGGSANSDFKGVAETRRPMSRRGLLRGAFGAAAAGTAGLAVAGASRRTALTGAADVSSAVVDPTSLAVLRSQLAGTVVGPGDPGWDQARQAWNLTNQNPAAVVQPARADDVVAAVRFARGHGLGVAGQSTGHGATGTVQSDVLLINNGNWSGVTIDQANRIGRVLPGTQWGQVADAAQPYGLVGLQGSSVVVGVVGYSLGGGLGWLGRRYGLAANSIRAVEMVNAQAQLVRVDAASDPELFWALRGGGGNFGLVTALEFDLYPVEQVYGGYVTWPIADAAEVLRHYRDWVQTVPESVTATAMLLRPPGAPAVVYVGAVYLGDAQAGAKLMSPLLNFGQPADVVFGATTTSVIHQMQPSSANGFTPPSADTFAEIPSTALGAIHLDPADPVPSHGNSSLLGSLPDAAIDTLVQLAGANSACPLPIVELRQIGGALGRPAPGAGALPYLNGEFVLFTLGITDTPADTQAALAYEQQVLGALKPWSNGGVYMNFVDDAVSPAGGWPSGYLDRLAGIKAQRDPGNLFRGNHPILPS